MIRFESDKTQAASNLKKHLTPFEEAKSVFFDNHISIETNFDVGNEFTYQVVD
jgi:uncharacterized DUF497 family protein